MANNILDLRMGVDAKLTDENISELDVGALSYSVDKQNLYIDALKEDKTSVERQMINADKAYAIRDESENIIAKAGYGVQSFQEGFIPEEKIVKIKLSRKEGSVDATYNFEIIEGAIETDDGDYTDTDENYFLRYPAYEQDDSIKYFKIEFINSHTLFIEDFSVQVYTPNPDIEYELVEYKYGALKNYSHTEGYKTIASGEFSHAEGQYTKAEGYTSHVEGNGAIASGDNSHAEGYRTIASGFGSHASGYETIASSNSGAAFGFYNKPEDDDGRAYLFTIGNGQDSYGNISRSNILALHSDSIELNEDTVINAELTVNNNIYAYGNNILYGDSTFQGQTEFQNLPTYVYTDEEGTPKTDTLVNESKLNDLKEEIMEDVREIADSLKEEIMEDVREIADSIITDVWYRSSTPPTTVKQAKLLWIRYDANNEATYGKGVLYYFNPTLLTNDLTDAQVQDVNNWIPMSAIYT